MPRPAPTTDLSGKTAIVTGASRGIGESIARSLAAAGAKVMLASRSRESLEEVAAAIRDDGGVAAVRATHTGDREALAALAAATAQELGSVDILVNNAATNPHFGPILESQPSHWEKTLDVNVRGYFEAARACVPYMRERGWGKIVNVASIAAAEPLEGLGLYAVSKAAVVMLTKVLALELARDGIQVNAIAPGLIKTKFSATLWKDERLAPRVRRQTPAGRFGTPDDVAGAALFLASPASDYVTGTVVTVDGGYTIAAKV
ncbi:MAG: glucose 1-dehydrogenase [Thermoanaerobaculia bacterium]|nr:glucose 1-dehydrogenase [Thermoanaerobaculia bacterium]